MAKVMDSKENLAKCVCPNCPTWMSDDCPKEKMEALYCSKGKTVCQLIEKGCICGTCPVWEENDLSRGYFCFNGQAE